MTSAKMGNCLKRSTTDDISLLRGSDSVRESSSDQLGPPAYQVSTNQLFTNIVNNNYLSVKIGNPSSTSCFSCLPSITKCYTFRYTTHRRRTGKNS